MSFLGAQNSIALGVQGLIHIDTGVVGSTDYLLAKSLRFRSSASAYLNRTSPATISTYTVSMWVKRGILGSADPQYLFSHFNSGNTNTYGISFEATTDKLVYFNGTQQATTAVYRDPAAWYHIVFSNNAGAFTMYVNGESVKTGTATAIPSSAVMNIARNTIAGAYWFDGEMAEINFVDGQALAPTAFGAYSTYNQWLPIKYAGTYGTNGFYLPFTNTTSTSTLVADSSGNANNWTPNNISLTAGSTYDSLTDVPTLTSTTVANYAVLNPLTKTGSAVVVQDANLTFTKSSAAYYNYTYGTIGVSSGKFYWEFTQGSTTDLIVGVSTLYADGAVGPGTSATSYIYMAYNGNKQNNGSSVAYGSAFLTLGYVIGVALNMDAGTLTFYLNGVSQGQAYSGLTGTYFPYVGDQGGQITLAYANFGQRPFAYPTLPSGFLPLNTYNI